MAKLHISVEVDDKGKVKLDGIGKKIGVLESKLKATVSAAKMLKTAMVGVVGYLGIRELKRAAEHWTQLSGAQSIAEQQLRQALITSGRFSQQFYDDTLKMAKGIQQLTGIGDEAIIQGQKMLMSFTRIPEELLPRVTKAMVDLSSFTGRTMEQSAKIFGKASLEMIGELRRLAIPIDVATFKMKGFEGVLEQVEAHVHDQVMAIREGYGAYKAFGDQVKEVKERVGDFINAIFIDTGVMESGITLLQRWNAELMKMKDAGVFTNWGEKVAETIIGKVADITYAFETLYGYIDDNFGTVLDPFIQKIKNILTNLEKMALAGTGATIGGTIGTLLGHPGMGIIAGGAIGYNWDYVEKAYEKAKEFFGGTLPIWFDENLIEGIDNRIKFYESRIKSLRENAIPGVTPLGIGDSDAPNTMRTIEDYLQLIEELRTRRNELMIDIGTQITPKKGFLPIDLEKETKDIHKFSDALRELWEESKLWRGKSQEEIAYGPIGYRLFPRKHDYDDDAAERAYKLAKKMSQTLQGGIVDGIVNGFENVDYRSLGKTLARNFASSFIEGISKDTTDKLTDKLFGTSGYLSKKAFGDTTWGNVLGAGALAYGAIQNRDNLNIGSGALYGGGIAALLGAPGWGIAAAAGGGGILGNLLGQSDFDKVKEQMAQQTAIATQQMIAEHEIYMQTFKDSIAGAIGAGFLEGVQTQDYENAIDRIKNDLSQTVMGQITSAITEQLAKPFYELLSPFWDKLDEWGDLQTDMSQKIIENYQYNYLESLKPFGGHPVNPITGLPERNSGWLPTGRDTRWDQFTIQGRTYNTQDWIDNPMAFQDIMSGLPETTGFQDLYTELKPEFEKYSSYTEELAQALGLNTDALKDNTDALIGEVKSFLRDLTVGAYAPVTSLEGMQAEYEKLYKSAYFDPEAFSEFASFTKSGYLDFMKAYGGYDQAVAGVISDTQNIDWYKEALAQQKEQQTLQNNINLTTHITVEMNGHEIGNAMAEQVTTNPNLNSAISSVVNSRIHH